MTVTQFIKTCNEERKMDRGFTFQETYDAYLPLINGQAANEYQSIAGSIGLNLEADDLFYILSYTGGTSRWINTAIKRAEKSQCKENYATGLDTALSKLPPYLNQRVYRMELNAGELTSNEQLNMFEGKIGQIFSVPFYWSTSKENFHNSELTFVIATGKAVSQSSDISQLTNNTTEREVLFGRTSKFRIVKVDYNRREIWVDEVSNEIKENFILDGVN
jgi:hypothetical protein